MLACETMIGQTKSYDLFNVPSISNYLHSALFLLKVGMLGCGIYVHININININIYIYIYIYIYHSIGKDYVPYVYVFVTRSW